MKRAWICVLLLAALFSLTACGKTDSGSNGDGGKQQATAPTLPEEAIEKLQEQGFEVVEQESEPAPVDVDALCAALFDVSAMTDSSGAPVSTLPESEGIPVNLGDAAKSKGETVPFSDEPWEEKGVEVVDFTAMMTPEERAEYEAMDWEAMTAEMESMVDGFADMGEGDFENYGGDTGGTEGMNDADIQQQLDDAMEQARQELEEFEIPEGYEEYFPDDFDPNDLLNDLDLNGLGG